MLAANRMEDEMHFLVGALLTVLFMFGAFKVSLALIEAFTNIIFELMSGVADFISFYAALIVQLGRFLFSKVPHFGQFWKIELQFEDGWRRHHMPFLHAEDAIFAAGQFMQATPEAFGWRKLRISASSDRHWYKHRISEFCRVGNVQAAMYELKNYHDSQAEMRRLTGRKAPVWPLTIEWTDTAP